MVFPLHRIAVGTRHFVQKTLISFASMLSLRRGFNGSMVEKIASVAKQEI